jgi:hypothetical protein
MSGWTLVTVVLIGAIAYIAPQQLQVVTYKTLLLTLAVVLAYHADRALYARVRDRLGEDMPRDVFSAARLLTRAIVFLAVVLGMMLGI